jgi:imidazolonepropionase-like amidohydrolase
VEVARRFPALTVNSLLMRQPHGLAFAFLIAIAACVGERRPDEAVVGLAPGDIWIRDVTLVSPDRETPLPHAHVVVRGGRILSAAVTAPQPLVEGVTVVAAEGMYLIPGLIDGHVHLAGVPGMRPEHETAAPALVERYYRQLPRSYLYFGFTAVVDLNVVDRAPLERMRAAEVAPAVFDCGNALALANGYPMVYRPPAERFASYPNFLYDPKQSAAIPSHFRAADHSPEAGVARVAAGGGRCVKAFYESGFGEFSGKLPVPTLEMMQRVRRASRDRRLPLLLHANSIDAHRFAVSVEPDAVVHGLWNWNGPADDAAVPDDVRAVVDDELARGIGMMPTLRVIGGLADLLDPTFLEDRQLRRVVPDVLLVWYRSEYGRWFAKEMAKGFSGTPSDRIRAIFQRVQARGQRAAVYFARGGGRIVFGSDTPSGPTYANPPGYNGYLELRALEAAGLSPRQLLSAATVENARLFGLTADYGTIEHGKVASLLLLRENPLVSTAALDSIDTVILRGRVVPRATLAADQ